MHVHFINKNHPKYVCIHPLLPVLCYGIPLNIKIILVFLVVPFYGTRGTAVGLYCHSQIYESLHQLRIHIIPLFLHLDPHNMIKGLLSSGRFSITNKNLRSLLSHMIATALTLSSSSWMLDFFCIPHAHVGNCNLRIAYNIFLYTP